MNTSPATDPWALNDHDPLSNTERHTATHLKTPTVQAISGAVTSRRGGDVAGVIADSLHSTCAAYAITQDATNRS